MKLLSFGMGKEVSGNILTFLRHNSQVSQFKKFLFEVVQRESIKLIFMHCVVTKYSSYSL